MSTFFQHFVAPKDSYRMIQGTDIINKGKKFLSDNINLFS
uniref:Uncharacterized protein n=1 Tax=Rhizophora mucronata TaxID=61149 RepID=A0A2P2NG75_RHIMU